MSFLVDYKFLYPNQEILLKIMTKHEIYVKIQKTRVVKND